MFEHNSAAVAQPLKARKVDAHSTGMRVLEPYSWSVDGSDLVENIHIEDQADLLFVFVQLSSAGYKLLVSISPYSIAVFALPVGLLPDRKNFSSTKLVRLIPLPVTVDPAQVCSLQVPEGVVLALPKAHAAAAVI